MSRYTDPKKAGYLLEAEACEAVTRELDRLIEKFQRKTDREAETRRKDMETALGYESEQDIHEAYGWGIITEAQYIMYSDLYRDGRAALERHDPTKAELTLNILRRIRKDLALEQEEWRLSAMSPEEYHAEMCRREQSKRKWKEQLQKLKEQMKAEES